MAENRRPSRAEVRNPVLGLPSAKAIMSLPMEQRTPLVLLLRDLKADAQARADHLWMKHKAPMAGYWKAIAVIAGHLARVLAREV